MGVKYTHRQEYNQIHFKKKKKKKKSSCNKIYYYTYEATPLTQYDNVSKLLRILYSLLARLNKYYIFVNNILTLLTIWSPWWV